MCVCVPIRFNCAYMVACMYNYVYACACIVIVVYSYSSACIHARVQRCLVICNLNYFSKAHVYIYSLCMYVWKLMCMSSFDHIQAASCSLGNGSGLPKKTWKMRSRKQGHYTVPFWWPYRVFDCRGVKLAPTMGPYSGPVLGTVFCRGGTEFLLWSGAGFNTELARQQQAHGVCLLTMDLNYWLIVFMFEFMFIQSLFVVS